MATRAQTVPEQIQELFSRPFEKAQIGSVTKRFTSKGKKVTKKFPNVDPRYYFERLAELDDLGVDYHIRKASPTQVLEIAGHQVVDAATTIVIEHEEYNKTVTGEGSEPIYEGMSEDEAAFAVKSAATDAFKRACAQLGIGAHLLELEIEESEDESEDEEEEDEKPRSRRTRSRRQEPEEDEEESEDEEEKRPARRSSSRSNSRSSGKGGSKEWDGEMEINFGSYNGVKYKDIHGSWLAFGEEKFDGTRLEFVKKEIDRRGDDFDPEERDPNQKGGGRTRSTNRTSGKRSGRALNNNF